MKSNKGILIVLSGPSGAGKDTICKAFLEKHKEDVFLSVSATTRKPREGQVEGIHYYFLPEEEFKNKIAKGDFLEWACVHGNYYGTPKSAVEEMLENGKNVILEIDVQGAVKIKENCKDGVFIFILPPSMEELKNRLTKRGTETPEEILRRFNTAYEEIKYIDKYNYGVVNDVVEDAVAKIDKILEAEKCRVTRIKDSIIKEAK